MMENRISLSLEILDKKGALQIAIDDEELFHLKNMSDGVVGSDRFVGTLVVQSNPRGRGINNYYATSHDYYLVYAKNPEEIEIIDQPLSEDQIKDYGHQDDESRYRLLPFRRSGGLSTPDERPNSEFFIYYSSKSSEIVGVGGSRRFPYPKEYEPEQIYILDDAGNIEEVPPDYFEDQEYIEIIRPIDTNGVRRVWRWSNRKKILNAVFKNEFVVQKQKSGYSVQLTDRIKRGRKPKTNWYDSKYDASSHGTILINNFFGERKVFGYPKSIHSTEDAIHSIIGEDDSAYCIDYFAGSGTTGHAVINLNRDDSGNRKYILVEMGQYFDDVTKPRIQKVVYSEDWKDGKPVSRKGSSHAFKYIKLESYEDTLNNLELKRTEEQAQALLGAETFHEDYLLRYMLDFESKGSLLDLQVFDNPFDYQLKIASSTVGEAIPTRVDLVETFNYLIGLQVRTLRKMDGVVLVEGQTRDNKSVLVIWRNTNELDSEGLNVFFTKHFAERQKEFDNIYVNGDNTLANIRPQGVTWKVHLIEEEFHYRMFEVKEV